MPAPATSTIGAPCWVDLFSSDPDRATSFYGELFGWSAKASPEFGGYINFARDGALVAGCAHNDGVANQPDAWNVYLRVADAQGTAMAVTAHGGQVRVPAMPVGELGTMALVSDVSGAAIGMWEPGAHTGFGRVAEPGAPSWFELHTTNYAPTVQFYKDVFRWNAATMSDSPEFRYTTLGEGDDVEAGIMDASGMSPPGSPSAWYIYFGVADADAFGARAVELGGTVLDQPKDTPYGRLATLTDPMGAAFKILQ